MNTKEMRNYIYKDKPKEACYGCKACAQVCPYNAIMMVDNEEGFAYPHIDTGKCMNCGLCEKVCPTQNENIIPLFYEIPQKVYALWSKHLNDRLESTSGGAFFVLAARFLDKGGVVYGVDYREDLTAYHRRISNKKALECLRGSKYMQSDINTTFRQVKEDLKKGYKVFFSGTPCQIAGLRLFLHKPYETLFTIDLVCHGVPSPLIFKEHINFLEKKHRDKIVNFKFRAKKSTGWRTYAKYIFQKGQPISSFWGEDYYCHAFHSGYLNRESCFTCDFSKSNRLGDITLSDFWNAEKHSKELKRQRKYGFNLVMCNTKAGIGLLNSIADSVELREFPVQIAIKGDVRLRNTEARPAFRNEAYKICQEKGYDYMVDTYGAKLSFMQKLLPTWMKNVIREIQCRI